LFHTNNRRVFDWVSQFSEFVPYKHQVKAMLNSGILVDLPVNKNTASIVGKSNVIETFYRPYSEKMWGMKLEELDPTITKRVPIRDDDNVYYFPDDEFQVLPKYGYHEVFQNILNHSNITLTLNCPFEKDFERDYDLILNSMAIDEYYDYCFGPLPYRSIKFHNYDLPLSQFNQWPVINFTHHLPYTRITEWKNFPQHSIENNPWTTLTLEEPCSYEENNNQRYYPVKDLMGVNRDRYNQYRKIENVKVIFIGRLGNYTYINMDQAINSALVLVSKIIKL
jgi:UDP-galactopyranose mutase